MHGSAVRHSRDSLAPLRPPFIMSTASLLNCRAPVLRRASLGCSTTGRVSARQPVARRAPLAVVAGLSVGSVKITVQGKHLDLTEAIKDYTNEKIGHSLEPFEEAVGVREVDVKFSTRGGEKSKGAKDQKVEVTVYSKNGTFRAEEHEGSLYAAIDKTADKLARTLRKRKEKNAKKGNTSAREVPMPEITMDFDGTMDPLKYGVVKLPEEVLRTKYFEMRPLSIDQAIESLESVGHEFYMFENEESGAINVVYRRSIGGYGLIVPRQP